jgi:hypothetical protein
LDNDRIVELFYELVCFMLNMEIPAPMIYQDSISVKVEV